MAKKTRKTTLSPSKKKQRITSARDESKRVNLKKKNIQSARTKKSNRQRRVTPDIIIRRTSGRKEKFDADRMTQTTARSGVPFLMARDIAKSISKKIKTEAKERGKRKTKNVTAGRVRNMVEAELRNRNRNAIASSYSGEQPENTRQGRHDLMKENQPMHDAQAANKSKLLFDSSSQFAKSTRPSAMKS